MIGKKSLLSSSLDADDLDDGLLGRSDNPMESMGNLMDVMLVFAAGLMVALIAHYGVQLSGQQVESENATQIDASQLQRTDESVEEGMGSYSEVGTVYQDAETGAYYVVTDEELEK